MRLLHILRSRIVSVLFRNKREDDLAEEMRLHIERQAEHWIAHGVDPEDAWLRARRAESFCRSVARVISLLSIRSRSAFTYRM